MRRLTMAASVATAVFFPVVALACGGAAGRDVAITYDGQKYTVTDTGREWLEVAFTAFGSTYNLQLAPGQSETPRTPGMFALPMNGYQSCVATPIPVASSGVSALRSGR